MEIRFSETELEVLKRIAEERDLKLTVCYHNEMDEKGGWIYEEGWSDEEEESEEEEDHEILIQIAELGGVLKLTACYHNEDEKGGRIYEVGWSDDEEGSEEEGWSDEEEESEEEFESEDEEESEEEEDHEYPWSEEVLGSDEEDRGVVKPWFMCQKGKHSSVSVYNWDHTKAD